MDELLNLTDEELNARAAKAIGMEERFIRRHEIIWKPSVSLHDSFQLQDEVARRDLRNEFTDALVSLGSAAYWNWRIANASARQRTIAAVYVLEGGK